MNESERYSLMATRSPDIVYVLDPEGRFVFVGGALETLTGYIPEDLLGKHFSSLIWPADVNLARWHFHERRTGSRATRGCQLRLKTESSKKEDLGYRTVELDAFGMWDKSPSNKDKTYCGTYGVVKAVISRVEVEEKMGLLCDEISLKVDHRRAISRIIIDLVEAERERIAGELHDHIGQSLVSFKMDLEAMNREETATAGKLKEGIKAAEIKAAQIIRDLRSTSYGLKPVGLDIVGLSRSLESLFRELRMRTGLNIHYFSRDVPERFHPSKELALFRIAQESLSNVMRHAHAREVYVNLKGKAGLLFMSVEDDGIGFDLQAVPESSLGLHLMRERTAQFGGKICIDSSIGRGTHILVEIPL